MLAYTVLPDDAVCINERIQNNAMFTQRGLVGVQIPSEYFPRRKKKKREDYSGNNICINTFTAVEFFLSIIQHNAAL